MAYRSELESRLAKKTTKAIVDYQMIEDGDRVMVGLSGGKDSWALLQVLDVLRQRAPIKFSLVAVNVDSGYKDYKHDVIARTCEARGWEYRIEHTGIGELIEDILDADQTPVGTTRCPSSSKSKIAALPASVGWSVIHPNARRESVSEPSVWKPRRVVTRCARNVVESMVLSAVRNVSDPATYARRSR